MKSTLLDEIHAISTAGGTRNRVDVVLADLDAADADALRAALRDPEIRPAQICKALARRDIKLGQASVRNWRTANP